MLKDSDEEYLRFLEKEKNDFNINELLIELVKWNPKFLESKLFREKKKRDISGLKSDFKAGNLFQTGDNLTIMDNPVALLMKAVGDDHLEEGCFNIIEDGVQCYTPRFENGERIAAFRSPHNSPNNIYNIEDSTETDIKVLNALDPQNDAKRDQSDQNIIPFAKIKRAENLEKSTLSAF